MMGRVISILLASLALLLAGCSGDGTDAVPTSDGTVIPKVTIAWPERSREVSAPGSALSAAITLESVGGTD
jgi:hypothetical protein